MRKATYSINTLKKKPFSSKEAQNFGINRHLLKQLEIQGAIEKIAHGIYVVTGQSLTRDEEFKRATFKVGQPAVICLLSALEYYDLTDIIPKEIWMMVPANKRANQREIRIFRTQQLNLDIGVVKRSGFSITTIERTIIDSLIHQRQLPVTIGINALRRALQLKKTTLSQIVDMAKTLHVFHRIRAYVEALS